MEWVTKAPTYRLTTGDSCSALIMLNLLVLANKERSEDNNLKIVIFSVKIIIIFRLLKSHASLACSSGFSKLKLDSTLILEYMFCEMLKLAVIFDGWKERYIER